MSHLSTSEVQPVVTELLVSLDEALGHIKQAQEALAQKEQTLKKAERRCSELEQQLNSQKVYLEKVASTKFAGFSNTALNELQEALVENDFCENSKDALKIASEINRNPEVALQLAIKLANFSATAPKSGCGFPKNASAQTEHSTSSEVEDWSVMSRVGA